MTSTRTVDFIIEDGRSCVIDLSKITHLLPASNGVQIFVMGGATITAQVSMNVAVQKIFGTGPGGRLEEYEKARDFHRTKNR